MACHTNICPAWSEEEGAKPIVTEKQDSKSDAAKKPGHEKFSGWRRCLRLGLCCRCKRFGHKWYHFALCPNAAQNQPVVDYKKIPLKQMTISFLDLPRELRDIIYGLVCDWNNAISDYTRPILKLERLKEQHSSYSGVTIPLPDRLSTPPLLLLNRQISSEAFEHLNKMPLVLPYYDRPLPNLLDDYLLWRLFGYNTLSRIPTIEVRVEPYMFFTCIKLLEGLDDEGEWNGHQYNSIIITSKDDASENDDNVFDFEQLKPEPDAMSQPWLVRVSAHLPIERRNGIITYTSLQTPNSQASTTYKPFLDHAKKMQLFHEIKSIKRVTIQGPCLPEEIGLGLSLTGNPSTGHHYNLPTL